MEDHLVGHGLVMLGHNLFIDVSKQLKKLPQLLGVSVHLLLLLPGQLAALHQGLKRLLLPMLSCIG